MSYCYSCKTRLKNRLLNSNAKKCSECQKTHCLSCIKPKLMGSYYCEVCHILNSRPLDPDKVFRTKPRDIICYLSKRKVQTAGCIEKADLIKLLNVYVNQEQVTNESSGRSSTFLHSLLDFQFRGHAQRPTTSRTSRSHQTENLRRSFSAENIPAPSNEEIISTPVKKFVNLAEIPSLDHLEQLSVKEMKELLTLNRVDYKGCVEKNELLTKVRELWFDFQNKSDVSNKPMEDLCKICMDATLDSVLLECGHMATCTDCGKKLSECPICRQYVSRVVRIFKA